MWKEVGCSPKSSSTRGGAGASSPFCCHRPLPLPCCYSRALGSGHPHEPQSPPPPCPAESSPLQSGGASEPPLPLKACRHSPGFQGRVSHAPSLVPVPQGLRVGSSSPILFFQNPSSGPVQATSYEFSPDASLHLQGSAWGGGGGQGGPRKSHPFPLGGAGSRVARTARVCVCLGLSTSEVTKGQVLSRASVAGGAGRGWLEAQTPSLLLIPAPPTVRTASQGLKGAGQGGGRSEVAAASPLLHLPHPLEARAGWSAEPPLPPPRAPAMRLRGWRPGLGAPPACRPRCSR